MPDLVILCEDTYINRTNKKNLMRIPTVVVCRNALVAYQYTNAYQLENRYDQFDRVLELISQPQIGPQKLARILLMVFSCWQSLRDSSSDGLLSHSIGTPLSENEPAQPFAPPLVSAASNRHDAKDTAPPEETQIVKPPDSGPPTTSLPRRPGASRTSAKPQQSFLFVDDNAINLKILSTYVKKLSRKSSTATNGKEALNAYKKTPAAYSCIFMDISMPVMDGLEATRAIRTYEREYKRDPVLIIALTGLASSETQQEAFTSAVDLFLTKPVKLKELSSVLRSQSLLADE